MFLLGLLITFALWALKIRGALIISIVVTTVIAILTGVQAIPTEFVWTPSFSTLGLGLQDIPGIFTIQAGALAAVLAIFTIMLSDFFDTMGTVTGVAAEAGSRNEDGSVPGVGRVLLIDGLAAVAGGAAGVSSNTTYIESAAGVGRRRADRDDIGRHRSPLPGRHLPGTDCADHSGCRPPLRRWSWSDS